MTAARRHTLGDPDQAALQSNRLAPGEAAVARAGLRAHAAAALCCAVLAACSSAPSVQIVAPLDGKALTAADDLDPANPGIQIAVDATTSAPQGSEATAFAGVDTARAQVSGGKLHFPSVTVRDGAAALTVGVVDASAGKAGQARVRLTADSFGSGCRIVAPADLSTVASDPGDTGLVTVTAQVACRGIAAGQGAQLFLDGAPTPSTALIDAAGQASFQVTLLPGENQLLLLVQGSEPQLSRVTLSSGRCRTELANPSGTTFNAQGFGLLGVADLAPATPGEQAHLVVRTSCKDGSPASLSLNGQSLFTSVVSAGQANFDVTLPEGAVTAQAFAGAAGVAGASRQVAWTVDSVVPAAQLTAPAPGALVSGGDGSGQVSFTGRVGPMGQGGFALLVLDEGTNLGGTELVLPFDATGAFDLAVALTDGTHTARVFAERQSGNRTTSATSAFQVLLTQGRIVINAPLAGAQLGSAQLSPSADGATLTFAVFASNLEGGTARVTCGSTSGSVSPIPVGGVIAIPVDLPLGGCAAQTFTCTATGQLASAGAPIVSSGPVTFTADLTAPAVTINAPSPSSTTASATVDLHAVSSCAGEAQRFQLSLNGTPINSGPVTANAIDLTGLALQPGQNRLDLIVYDANNNAGSASATVTRLVGVAGLVFATPAAAATLGIPADVDQDLSNGLQALVQVQLDNRPAGTVVSLSVASNDAGGVQRPPITAATQSLNGHLVATFAAVTLPEGSVQLQACETDALSPPPSPTCVSEQVTVFTGRTICNIALPKDGAMLSAAADTQPQVPGFQTDVTVQTSGDRNVSLTVTDPAGNQQSIAPVSASGGAATFSGVPLGPGDGIYKLDAVCASSTLSQGRSLTNKVTLTNDGPGISFAAPVNGQVFNAASADSSSAAGFQVDVQLALTGASAAGATVTLGVSCANLAAQTLTGTADASGNLTLPGVTLLNPDGSEGTCTLTASAVDAAQNPGLPTQIAVVIDRSLPTPAFASPPAGATYLPTAPELDCTTPSLTVLRAAQISLADQVPASGLSLFVNGVQATATPTAVSGGWSFPSVPLAAGANTLVVVAVDAAQNRGTASVSFFARCQAAQTTLTLVTSGNKLGYAQDKSHSTPGEQIGVQVSAPSADGTGLRVCSTVGGDQSQPCSAAGSFALALPSPAPTLAGGSATFDLTLADGPQQLSAEVTDPTVSASASQGVVVRASPPVITSALTILENDGDTSLNQAELASATLHFLLQVSGAVAGQTLEIHSTTQPASSVLGSATVPANGTVSVPVTTSLLLGAGGYQQFVFYALVHDDAGNPASIPGAEYPGEPAVTLGTQASPFVVAPNPTVSLDRPAPATSKLLAADDTRCANGTCPGTDPLWYGLSSSTSAPDGSQCVFLLDGAQVGTAITLASGGCAATEQLANGTARTLAVRISDPYGNVVTSAARTELIDSVPPALTIVQPAIDPIITPQAQLTVQTGSSLEAGQLISIFADGTFVGSANAAGSSTQVTVQLSNGVHSLVARAQDAAGNPGASQPITVNESFAGPAVRLSTPTPQAGTVAFGTSTRSGNRCVPALQTSSSGTPDGTQVTLFVAPTSDCTGTPTAGAQMAAVSGGLATFSNLLTFADGDAGFLCAQVTVSAIPAHSTAQQFACDLQTPALTFTKPAAGQVYVAPPLAGRAAVASQSSDPTILQADYALTATAKSGSVVSLTLDNASAPFATTTLSADCANCAVTLPSAQATVAAGTLAHAIHASVTAPSGNSASAQVSVQIDLVPPANAQPTFSVTHRLAGVIHVDIASVPGDDGTTGAAPSSYDVRWSTSGALTAANWSSGNALSAPELPAPQTPGTHQVFDITLPTDQASLWIGVRAVDQVGNLGAFAGATSDPATVSTQLTRSPSIALPTPTSSAASRMRVADIDGDGFDDVIISFPFDAGGNGAVYLYFGSATGLGSTPMVFSGQIAGGQMGSGGQAFDVGDFDGDGKADIVAGATDCATAQVYLWKGSDIAPGKATNAAPAPKIITDGTNLIGGTVRAVGHVTGGTAGVDLFLSKYTAGCGSSQTFTAGILPGASVAAPDWTNGTTAAFSTSGLTTITLTAPASHQFLSVDAAALDVLEAGTSNDSLFVAFIDSNAGSLFSGLRTLPGSKLGRGASVAFTSGTAILAPTVTTPTGPNFGLYLDSGRDATGDGKKDLVLSDANTKQVFLYDSTTLLSGTPQPVQHLDTNPETKGDVGFCAVLLPDLNGDGIAEFGGCANVAFASVYFAFGGTGPALSFFTPEGWLFTPRRGQRISGSGSFGQKVGAGHLSSRTAIDLVVLSETGSGADTLTLLR